MPGSFLDLTTGLVGLFAFADPVAAPAAEPAGSPLAQLLPLIFIPFLFYFLILRPQQAQEKKRRATIDRVKKNDKVLTSGGIYGTVTSVDPDSDKVVVRVDDDKGVKMSFSKSAIVKVLDEGTGKADA